MSKMDSLILYPSVLESEGNIQGISCRGQLGQSGRPRGQTFALNGPQGEVGVSPPQKKQFF